MKRAAILMLLVGCAEPRGVDLALVPDPNVNSAEQVLDAVDSIVMIVDSPDGLYPPGSERSSATAQIENADGDAELELIVNVAVPNERLPWVRLLEGSLPDVPLELRVLGMPPEPGAPSVAVGRVQGVRLTSPIERLDVPFNLRPELLPPRVTEVLPSDGSTLLGCEVPVVYLMFSRPIDPATVPGAVRVDAASITSVRVDPSGLTAEVAVTGLSGDGTTLRFGLAVDSTLTDAEGRALDQIPSEPGAQGYEAQIALYCGPGTQFPDMPCVPGALDGRCEYLRLMCVDGYCVPNGCDGAACNEGSVCDPATSGCVLDCRSWGDASSCPPERPSCDAASGVCR